MKQHHAKVFRAHDIDDFVIITRFVPKKSPCRGIVSKYIFPRPESNLSIEHDDDLTAQQVLKLSIAAVTFTTPPPFHELSTQDAISFDRIAAFSTARRPHM
jgi:hypothetical protein